MNLNCLRWETSHDRRRSCLPTYAFVRPTCPRRQYDGLSGVVVADFLGELRQFGFSLSRVTVDWDWRIVVLHLLFLSVLRIAVWYDVRLFIGSTCWTSLEV